MSILTGVLLVGLSILVSLLWCNIVAAGDHLTRRARSRALVKSDRAAPDALV